jgi:hypothetical protein
MITNNIALNTHTEVFVYICFLFSWVYMRFRVLSHMLAVSLDLGEILSYSPKQLHCFSSLLVVLMLPILQHLHRHLLLSIFLIIELLVGRKWYLSVVLVCVSLMIKMLSVFSGPLQFCFPNLTETNSFIQLCSILLTIPFFKFFLP